MLYGIQSLEFLLLQNSITDVANYAGLDIKLSVESNIDVFIRDGVLRIPAVRIDDELLDKGEQESLPNYMRSLSTRLLKKTNFGNMKKIIIPIDFSETSENALVYGLHLAKTLGAMIEVMHVYHPQIQAADYLDEEVDSQEQYRREKFDEFVNGIESRWFGEPTGQIIQSKFCIGFAADQLIKASSDEKETLIVMGSSGSSPGVKKFIGSVSTKVALYAKCPVYIIPPGATYLPLSNVVYCSKETSMDSELALQVIELVKSNNPIVHLLHVGFEDQYRMKSLFEVWSQHYPSSKIKDVSVSFDNEGTRITKYCKSNEADLVILARKERTFLEELFHKSVTKDLVISALQPLLVLHFDEKSHN